MRINRDEYTRMLSQITCLAFRLERLTEKQAERIHDLLRFFASRITLCANRNLGEETVKSYTHITLQQILFCLYEISEENPMLLGGEEVTTYQRAWALFDEVLKTKVVKSRPRNLNES